MHLVFVDYPAFVFFIPSIIAFPLFNDLINGYMLESGILGQKFTMASLSNPRRPRYDDIGFRSHAVNIVPLRTLRGFAPSLNLLG